MLNHEFIKNVRWGVATNSSSTHSIIHSPELIRSGQHDSMIDGDGEFGWEFFTAASKEAKEDYMISVLTGNIPYQYTNIFWDILKSAEHDEAASFIANRSIDHESMITIPKYTTNNILNYEFFKEYKDYIVNNDFIILGGNDNTEDEHHLALYDDNAKESFSEIFRDNDVTFKNGNYWVVISEERKLRVKFEEGPLKPEYPELIDFKITNYCDRGCNYCYQGSTTEGQHVPIEEIKSMTSAIVNWGLVTEFAIGGGEPVQHPDFPEILRTLKPDGSQFSAILNFTTRIPADQWSPELVKTVQEKVTGIAYSVETPDDVIKYHTSHKEVINTKKFLIERARKTGGDGVKMYVHIIPELLDDEQFRNILGAVEEINKETMNGHTWETPDISVTLLGLKSIGRAKDIERSPRPEIIDIMYMMQFTPIGIDTKFASDYQEYLDQKEVPRKLYTTQEGEFSMYIDAVEKKAYKSSYELDNPIDTTRAGYGGRPSYVGAANLFKEVRSQNDDDT